VPPQAAEQQLAIGSSRVGHSAPAKTGITTLMRRLAPRRGGEGVWQLCCGCQALASAPPSFAICLEPTTSAVAMASLHTNLATVAAARRAASGHPSEAWSAAAQHQRKWRAAGGSGGSSSSRDAQQLLPPVLPSRRGLEGGRHGPGHSVCRSRRRPLR